jgi:hypothetical protein
MMYSNNIIKPQIIGCLENQSLVLSKVFIVLDDIG